MIIKENLEEVLSIVEEIEKRIDEYDEIKSKKFKDIVENIDIRNVEFKNCILENVNLQTSNIISCEFTNCIFKNCDFSGVNVYL